VSSVVVYVGALEHGQVRAALWAAAVAIDLIGAGFGFYVPGLGGSATREWTISGAHFAERCQAFVLIALGESIVITGTRIAAIEHPTGAEIGAFVMAFAASAGLWWIYFDRAAEDSASVIESSDDPGRLARNAFHWIHPLIVGGIIVAAAADEVVLEHPAAEGHTTTSWLVLGGVVLYLGGHALFKAVIWQVVSWPRVIGAAICVALFAVAPQVSALVLIGCALAVILGVAVADRVLHPADQPV
jgi:low temperature requirement protein LtrA